MAKTATKNLRCGGRGRNHSEAIQILPAETETKMLALVDPFNAKLAELREQYGNIIITDKASLEKAQVGVRTMTGLRNQVEKRRLEIFRPVNKLASDVKAKVDAFVADVKAIEQPIRDAINAEELRQQELAREEHIRRVGMLTEAGWTLVGQFYVCGPHRIVFDEIDTADATQLNQWVADGNAWVEQERQRLAKEAEARRAEEAAAEARRKEQAEWEKFQRWKPSKAAPAADVPVFGAQAAPNPVGGAQAAPEGIGGAQVAPEPVIKSLFDNPQESVSVPESAMPKAFPDAVPAAPTQATQAGQAVQVGQVGQVAEHPVGTIEQLASLRRSSVEFLTKTPEYRVFYNSAINDVFSRFSTETKTWEQWMETFKGMLK